MSCNIFEEYYNKLREKYNIQEEHPGYSCIPLCSYPLIDLSQVYTKYTLSIQIIQEQHHALLSIKYDAYLDQVTIRLNCGHTEMVTKLNQFGFNLIDTKEGTLFTIVDELEHDVFLTTLEEVSEIGIQYIKEILEKMQDALKV